MKQFSTSGNQNLHILGAAEKAQQLRALAVLLQRTQVQFPAPTLDDSQSPVTLDAEHLTPFLGLCAPTYTQAIHSHTNKNRISLQININSVSKREPGNGTDMQSQQSRKHS